MAKLKWGLEPCYLMSNLLLLTGSLSFIMPYQRSKVILKSWDYLLMALNGYVFSYGSVFLEAGTTQVLL